MKVGDKVLYCKVVNDFTTEELVDILHIDEESKSATIYIPTLKRERDTDLTRLYVKQVDDTIKFTLPKRKIWILGNKQSTYISPHRSMIFALIESKLPIFDWKDVDLRLYFSIIELYNNIDSLYESIDIIHKNQLILDRDINSLHNFIIKELKTQNEINKKLNLKLKNLEDKIKELHKK
jgi:hypothetical protein